MRWSLVLAIIAAACAARETGEGVTDVDDAVCDAAIAAGYNGEDHAGVRDENVCVDDGDCVYFTYACADGDVTGIDFVCAESDDGCADENIAGWSALCESGCSVVINSRAAAALCDRGRCVQTRELEVCESLIDGVVAQADDALAADCVDDDECGVIDVHATCDVHTFDFQRPARAGDPRALDVRCPPVAQNTVLSCGGPQIAAAGCVDGRCVSVTPPPP